MNALSGRASNTEGLTDAAGALIGVVLVVVMVEVDIEFNQLLSHSNNRISAGWGFISLHQTMQAVTGLKGSLATCNRPIFKLVGLERIP